MALFVKIPYVYSILYLQRNWKTNSLGYSVKTPEADYLNSQNSDLASYASGFQTKVLPCKFFFVVTLEHTRFFEISVNNVIKDLY